MQLTINTSRRYAVAPCNTPGSAAAKAVIYLRIRKYTIQLYCTCICINYYKIHLLLDSIFCIYEKNQCNTIYRYLITESL